MVKLVIIFNGENMEIESGTKLTDLLAIRGLERDRIVVEYNFNIVKEEDWDNISLKENDTIEVLRFVGGG